MNDNNKKEKEPFPQKNRSFSSPTLSFCIQDRCRVKALIMVACRKAVIDITYATMIRKNLLNCNLIRIKKSTKSLFDDCMSSFNPEMETCPICKCRGNCRKHAYYDRYIIDFMDGIPEVRQIRILRLKCSCGHTHAVLPDPIIPYDSYSLFFILRLLIEYSLHRESVLRLCERFAVSMSTLYRWLKIYQIHRREWQGALKATEQSILASLKELLREDPFSGFALLFFQKTLYTFLQSHKNPSVSPRNTSPPDSIL